MKSSVLLFSGGIDTFLTEKLITKYSDTYKDEKGDVYKVNRVFFHIGEITSTEYEFLKRRIKSLPCKVDIFEIKSDIFRLLEGDAGFVKNRNTLFITFAQACYDADLVIMSSMLEDTVSDQTREFRSSISNTLSISAGKPVSVISFFENQSRASLIKKLKSEDIEPLIIDTFSCYSKKSLEELTRVVKVYKFVENKFELHKESQIYYGCLECPACYRKLIKISNHNLFIPFDNMKLVLEREETRLQDPEYCKKFKDEAEAARKYHQFLFEVQNK